VPLTPPPTQPATTEAPATAPPALPSLPPTGGVAAIQPVAAGLALTASGLVIVLGLLLRKVMRRGRSGVGL